MLLVILSCDLTLVSLSGAEALNEKQPHLTPPKNLVARVGDQSVALHWDCAETNVRFQVYRARAPQDEYLKISSQPVPLRSFADLTVTNGGNYFYRVSAVHHANESARSEIVRAAPKAFSNDREFLNLLQQTAFDFFWHEANPKNGLVRDRSRTNSMCSIAATGFGLTAMGIGVEHGWISREQGAQRVLTTLKTFWEMPQGTNATGVIGHRGWFYHFLEMDTAARKSRSELSSIDTALFLAGALDAKQFFNRATVQEKEIRSLAAKIFRRVDWNWMSNRGDSLTMGWSPEHGFIKSRWIGYNEAMILYLMGLGARNEPLPKTHWKSWTAGYKWRTHYGQTYLEFPPLFGHQYSHCWIDFRGKADAYMKAKGISYFENSRRAAMAQREYAIANPLGFKGYSSNVWGITACDGPGKSGLLGYAGRGAPPPLFDDGTIAPTAAGGSIVFTPEMSLSTLRHFYEEFRPEIWTGYGFCDAFNLSAGWWDDEVLGIDQGPILIMIENYLNGSVWNRFMKNPEIKKGLARAGFRPMANGEGN